MAQKLSFDPYLGWVDVTRPDQIPEDTRMIGAGDLLRYEKLGVDTAKKFAEVDTSIAALEDPLGFGYVTTFLGPVTGPQVFPAANAARYLRVLTPGAVKFIDLQVEVSAGNICVGVYRGAGTGLNRVPGALAATSGVVPCPAKGHAAVPLTTTVTAQAGDFLAISCDSATASFLGFTGVASQLGGYQFAGAVSAHPLAGGPTVTATPVRTPALVGHA